MKNKKNNAVEKVEKIVKKNTGETTSEDIESKNDENSKKGCKKRKGLIGAVITLSVIAIALASTLTIKMILPSSADKALESSYAKAFYNTVEYVDNIDLNLSKTFASKDKKAMQGYLIDTAINSELAENDLQTLPLHDESKFYTTKLVNQIGDYSKYLNDKLIKGQSLTEQDMQTLYQLYQANKSFRSALNDMINGMGPDYSFSSMSSGGNSNIVNNGFNELQNLSVEYPELIYDGPFSDGITSREIKGLSGEEISSSTAQERFKLIFADYNLENVQSVGETNANIECFNVQGEIKGETLYAQISKKGGKLVMFAYAGSCKGQNIEQSQAEQVAKEFLEKADIFGMKAVWTNLENNVYTFNFAYETQGVIVYSDLVKVRVCAETGMVIGLEASSYYTNHTERIIEPATLSQKGAMQSVSDNIEIASSRLALVPVGVSGEKLCYEFSGVYDDETYYVYIDAISGEQVELFRVIKSTEGQLLM